MIPQRIQRKRTKGARLPANTVCVSRGTKWGNPFSHRSGTLAEYRVRTREAAIERYAEWVTAQPQLMAALPELRGKVLGCWCKPQACHGDVLAKLADVC